MNDFLSISGHGFYLWGAYGLCAAVTVLEPLLVLRRQRLASSAAAAFVADETDLADVTNKSNEA